MQFKLALSAGMRVCLGTNNGS
ncbi:hypothetical protein MTR67_012703 [Solanum verrucosum]|uniref:Uncharacterized protein n=1 Tax=Solanum verrucosum TaxID=315347 RepID=A0AAF0QA71_SOLVR|nr:hypothetical protein MTR67_012703 [Solanum verrucosum]